MEINNAIFSKEIEIKKADILIFPQNIEFLQITRINNDKMPTKQINTQKKKEENLNKKPKLSSETSDIIMKRTKNEINLIEASILRKEKQINELKSKNVPNEKEIEKNEELKKLISKWKIASQEALIELHKTLQNTGISQQKIEFKDMFKLMSIDHKILDFNLESEEFENE